MAEKIYPKGLRVFPPHAKAPDFVKGTLMITPRELVDFCTENANLLTDYKGTKQLKCQILEGDKGMYFVVDTWKPDGQQGGDSPQSGEGQDNLPF